MRGMSRQRQVCTRCTNDASVADLEFDASGLCSLCQEYDGFRDRLSDPAGLTEIWLERLEARRGRETYDVICGLSGGKDSAYVLYQLVRTYGLRVKAFTYD